MEIAVMLGFDGNTSGFEHNGEVAVFEKKTDGIWEKIRYTLYETGNMDKADDLRENLGEICRWLGDCKLMVVNRIRGVHYLILEKYQISMLEIQGKPEDFLDSICECGNHMRSDNDIPMEHTAIYEQREGYYYTDLRDVMSGKTSFNSKQILLPFFSNEKFKVLEIICDHVPKWFEKDLHKLGLKYNAQNYKKCVKVFVEHA